MKRDRKRVIWLNQREDEAYKAAAESEGMSVAEWMRQRCNGKQARVRKPVFDAVEQSVTRELTYEPDFSEVEVAEEDTEQRQAYEAMSRKEWAFGECKKAGGVEIWFGRMTEQERQEWATLKPYLLDCERFAAEQAEWFRKHGSPDSVSDKNRIASQSHTQHHEQVTILDNGMILS